MIAIERHKSNPSSSAAQVWEWNPVNPTGAQTIGSTCNALGSYSIAGGYQNETDGDYSTAFGAYNFADGNYSIALGHNAQALGTGSVAISGNAIGDYSFAMYSVATGNYSFASGLNALSSGAYSVAMGYYPIASGLAACALNEATEAPGEASLSTGVGSVALYRGSHARAGGSINAHGDCQEITFHYYGITTDGIPTNLALDGSLLYPTIAEGVTALLTVDCVTQWQSGIAGSSVDCMFLKRVVAIQRKVAGGLVVLDQSNIYYHDISGVHLDLNFGNSGNELVAVASGYDDYTLKWQVTVKMVMVQVF